MLRAAWLFCGRRIGSPSGTSSGERGALGGDTENLAGGGGVDKPTPPSGVANKGLLLLLLGLARRTGRLGPIEGSGTGASSPMFGRQLGLIIKVSMSSSETEIISAES